MNSIAESGRENRREIMDNEDTEVMKGPGGEA